MRKSKRNPSGKKIEEDDETKFMIVIDNEVSLPNVMEADEKSTINNNINSNANNKPKVSIFSRLGDGIKDKPSGTILTIDNLNRSVTSEDIKDLCESVGEIKSVNISSNPFTGKQIAEVVFSRRSVALECITKFHNVKLDGTPMIVKLKGIDGKDNPFNPAIVTEANSKETNVRVGLFGTAIDGDDEEEEFSEPSERLIITTGTKGRVIKESNTNPFHFDNNYYQGDGFLDRSKPMKRFKSSSIDNKPKRMPSVNGKNDRGGKFIVRNNKKIVNKKKSNSSKLSEADLDNELANYKLSSEDLDNDLSNYMKTKK